METLNPHDRLHATAKAIWDLAPLVKKESAWPEIQETGLLNVLLENFADRSVSLLSDGENEAEGIVV